MFIQSLHLVGPWKRRNQAFPHALESSGRYDGQRSSRNQQSDKGGCLLAVRRRQDRQAGLEQSQLEMLQQHRPKVHEAEFQWSSIILGSPILRQ